MEATNHFTCTQDKIWNFTLPTNEPDTKFGAQMGAFVHLKSEWKFAFLYWGESFDGPGASYFG